MLKRDYEERYPKSTNFTSTYVPSRLSVSTSPLLSSRPSATTNSHYNDDDDDDELVLGYQPSLWRTHVDRWETPSGEGLGPFGAALMNAYRASGGGVSALAGKMGKMGLGPNVKSGAMAALASQLSKKKKAAPPKPLQRTPNSRNLAKDEKDHSDDDDNKSVSEDEHEEKKKEKKTFHRPKLRESDGRGRFRKASGEGKTPPDEKRISCETPGCNLCQHSSDDEEDDEDDEE